MAGVRVLEIWKSKQARDGFFSSPPLHEAPYNLTQAQSVMPFSVFLLTNGITCIFSGRMIGKAGPKKPAIIGAIFLGLGYLICCSMKFFAAYTFEIIVVGFALVAGLGIDDM